MYAVIYEFKVKPGKDEEFISAWEAMTELIYKNDGSLGSRLHKDQDHVYIAYAKWPSQYVFEHPGNHMPEIAHEIRSEMHDCCNEINTLYTMEVISDLIEEDVFRAES